MPTKADVRRPFSQSTRKVPARLLEILLPAFARDTAHTVLRHLTGPYSSTRIVQPGDRYGATLAWLWRENPAWAIALLSDLIWELRLRGDEAGLTPTITLDELLRGTRIAVRNWLSTDDLTQLIIQARDKIPKTLGPDVNRRTEED